MTRLARIVIPNCPHHVTQRGNRKQQTFFCREDYLAYIDLMSQSCNRYEVKILAYCLMPNHIHLVAVPDTIRALALSVGEAHEFYTKQVNYRMDWTGHLWQGRFFSVPMDEDYTQKCIRYVELNPVRANLCLKPEDYEWSSAKARIDGSKDKLLTADTQMAISPWHTARDQESLETEFNEIRKNSRTGRPLGEKSFIERLEVLTGRTLLPLKGWSRAN